MGLRDLSDQTDVTTLTPRACGPLGPSSTSYSTFTPSSRLLKPSPADRAEVDEHVLASIVLRDEAVALVVAEPLDGSGCHLCTSLDCVTNVQRKAQAKTGTRSHSQWS